MWQEKDNLLQKTVVLENFLQVIEIVNKIAKIAESKNHHPDLKIFDYKKLEITLTTHETGKVTQIDHQLAREIDKILES